MAVRGFCYLEPLKHIEYLHMLDDDMSQEFGLLLVRASRALKATLNARLVYVYIFGDHIPHLHAHLAPHFDGDNYYGDIIKPGIRLSKRRISKNDFDTLSAKVNNLMQKNP
jgi:diadenosine tetraphosphate (Ap4A) HIT family hydrolase